MQIKRNRSLIKSIWLAMIIPFILASAGCVFGRTEAPYLDDRTEGWQPRLTLKTEFGPDELDAEASELWKNIIHFIPYSFGGEVSKDNVIVAASEAIKLNLDEAYAAIGTEYELIEKNDSFSKNTIGILTDSTLVLFAADTGRLKFCADLKDRSALKMNSDGALLLTIDAAQLSSSALRELQKHSSFNDPVVKPSTCGVTLPLTAQGAFDISLGMDVKSWNGSSRLAATGGAFKVYRSEASNALFVATNTYIQAFDVDTGEMLLMLPYETIGNCRYGHDESTRL
ncbi:MAG: hypothetical protein IKI64_01155 [Clostridia bacterium]|nr:hypothetical protein [Clostridia bacterium]